MNFPEITALGNKVVLLFSANKYPVGNSTREEEFILSHNVRAQSIVGLGSLGSRNSCSCGHRQVRFLLHIWEDREAE